MPRALPYVALLLLLAVPSTLGAVAIPGSLQAQGALSWFQFYPAGGLPLEGGPYEWTRVCGECNIRVRITDGSWIYHDVAVGTVFLEPGLYELREFRGIFFGNDVAPRHFEVQVHGLAKVVEIPAMTT